MFFSINDLSLGDAYSVKFLRLLDCLVKNNHGLVHFGDLDAIAKAMKFAKHFHDGQFRKTGEPVYSHPVGVAELVMRHFRLNFDCFANTVIAALLHDTVEDCESCTLELIEGVFNERVAELVGSLTRKVIDGKKQTVEEIMQHLYDKGDRCALLIKVCDRIHNLKTMPKYKTSAQKYKQVTESVKSAILYSVASIGGIELEDLLIAELNNNTTREHSKRDPMRAQQKKVHILARPFMS